MVKVRIRRPTAPRDIRFFNYVMKITFTEHDFENFENYVEEHVRPEQSAQIERRHFVQLWKERKSFLVHRVALKKLSKVDDDPYLNVKVIFDDQNVTGRTEMALNLWMHQVDSYDHCYLDCNVYKHLHGFGDYDYY